MYFPFLRTKENEVLAVARVAPMRQVVPVFEPVQDQSSTLAALATLGQEYCLVVNPKYGDYANVALPATIVSLFAQAMVVPTFLITYTTAVAEVSAFIASFGHQRHAFFFRDSCDAAINFLAAASNPTWVFIDRYCIAPLGGVPSSRHVDVSDPFRVRSGALYPPDEFFSDRLMTIGNDPRYDHFGDFSIVGDRFGGGGAPFVVVLQHVYESSAKLAPLRIRRYKSTINAGSRTGAPLKALEAIEYLLDDQPLLHSLAPENATGAIPAYASVAAGTYPGGMARILGTMKRFGIAHHLELMESLL